MDGCRRMAFADPFEEPFVFAFESRVGGDAHDDAAHILPEDDVRR